MNIINAFPNRVIRRHRYPVNFRHVTNTVANTPKVNIIENDDEFAIQLAVPGMAKEDIKLTVENGTLTIGATVENETKEEGKFTRQEFVQSSFKRSFSLPDTIDIPAVKASMNQGVLTVHLPKKEEAKPAPARTIEIG